MNQENENIPTIPNLSDATINTVLSHADRPTLERLAALPSRWGRLAREVLGSLTKSVRFVVMFPGYFTLFPTPLFHHHLPFITTLTTPFLGPDNIHYEGFIGYTYTMAEFQVMLSTLLSLEVVNIHKCPLAVLRLRSLVYPRDPDFAVEFTCDEPCRFNTRQEFLSFKRLIMKLLANEIELDFRELKITEDIDDVLLEMYRKGYTLEEFKNHPVTVAESTIPRLLEIFFEQRYTLSATLHGPPFNVEHLFRLRRVQVSSSQATFILKEDTDDGLRCATIVQRTIAGSPGLCIFNLDFEMDPIPLT